MCQATDLPQSKICLNFHTFKLTVCVCVLSCDIGAAPESEVPRSLLWLTSTTAEKKRSLVWRREGSFTAARSKFGSQLSELGTPPRCRMLYWMCSCFGDFLQHQCHCDTLFKSSTVISRNGYDIM